MFTEADSAIGSVTDVVFGENDSENDSDTIEWITGNIIGYVDEHMEKIKHKSGLELLQKERIKYAFTNANSFDLLCLFFTIEKMTTNNAQATTLYFTNARSSLPDRGGDNLIAVSSTC